MKGLEPSTPGATVQCSAIELHPPCFVARPEGGYADRHAVIALLTSLRHTRSLSHAQEMRQEGIEPPTHGLEVLSRAMRKTKTDGGFLDGA